MLLNFSLQNRVFIVTTTCPIISHEFGHAVSFSSPGKLYFMPEWLINLRLMLQFFSSESRLSYNNNVSDYFMWIRPGHVRFVGIKAPRGKTDGGGTPPWLLRSKETCAKRKVNSSTGLLPFLKRIVSFFLSPVFTYRFASRRAHIENRMLPGRHAGKLLPHAERLYEL